MTLQPPSLLLFLQGRTVLIGPDGVRVTPKVHGSKPAPTLDNTDPEAFEEFIMGFLAVKRLNLWTESRARRELGAAVRGAAQRQVANVPIDSEIISQTTRDAAPIEGLIEAYRERFVPAGAIDRYRCKYQLFFPFGPRTLDGLG